MITRIFQWFADNVFASEIGATIFLLCTIVLSVWRLSTAVMRWVY